MDIMAMLDAQPTDDELLDDTPHRITLAELPLSHGAFRWLQGRAEYEECSLETALARTIQDALDDKMYAVEVERSLALVDHGES